MKNENSNRLGRLAPDMLVAAVPETILSIGVALFVLNHFFARPPYLLDAGWYSPIVYRSGVFPDKPQIACNYADWYYSVHVPPLLSLFSLLSYLSPLERIEWYAFFQGIVFLPIGITTSLVAVRIEAPRTPSWLPVTIIAGLAFCFSGQVIA